MVNEPEPANHESTGLDQTNSSVISPPPPTPETPSEYSLREEIRRGWEWVVFVWQMMRRIGGPLEILQALGTLIQLLVRRTLTQWGLLKEKP